MTKSFGGIPCKFRVSVEKAGCRLNEVLFDKSYVPSTGCTSADSVSLIFACTDAKLCCHVQTETVTVFLTFFGFATEQQSQLFTCQSVSVAVWLVMLQVTTKSLFCHVFCFSGYPPESASGLTSVLESSAGDQSLSSPTKSPGHQLSILEDHRPSRMVSGDGSLVSSAVC
jgi:hypothetical protein